MERERRFVAEASHELRTPLASLKAELELALRRPRSPGSSGRDGVAAEETDRLAALAEDLLVLARSDEGVLRVDRRPIPARELLESGRGASPRAPRRPASTCRWMHPRHSRAAAIGPCSSRRSAPRRQRAPLRVRNGPPRGRRRQRIAFPRRERRGTGIRARVPPARVRALHPRRRVAGRRLRRPRARDRGSDRPGAWRHGVHSPKTRPVAAPGLRSVPYLAGR